MKIGVNRQKTTLEKTSYSWAAFSQNTDQTPDVDTEIDISQAISIAIQANTLVGDNDSSDVDINVESSLDGTTWDTIAIASKNMGDNVTVTFLVEPGANYIRLRADNNDGANNAAPEAIVLIRR